uniref:Ribonuclease PIN domain-containing protein n=1 Tax=Amphimedon queenslandica TaxID=400682 RepID=A0A1X7TJJ2_AMPQE
MASLIIHHSVINSSVIKDSEIISKFLHNIRALTDFSKKTGDYQSLSAVDLRLIALTYQLEKERGPQRGTNLRTDPIQTNKEQLIILGRSCVNSVHIQGHKFGKLRLRLHYFGFIGKRRLLVTDTGFVYTKTHENGYLSGDI